MEIHAHVRALNEQRIKAHKALNDHIDGWYRDNPGVPMNAEALEVEARIQGELDDLEAEIRRFVDRETRERESAQVRETHASLFGGDPVVEQRQQSESERFAAWARGETPNREYHVDLKAGKAFVEAIRAGASAGDIRNVIQVGTDSGSLLVPTDLSSTIYQYMTASVAMLRMPTTKINTNGGNPIDFPKVTTHGIATQVLENTAVGGTDPVFGKMTLNAYKRGQLVQLSSETLQDDGVDILGFVAGNIARAVGELIATDFVSGDGNGDPNGIMTSITNTSGASGTVHGVVAGITYDNLVDVVYKVNGNYRARPSTGFLMRDLTAGALRKLRDGAGGTVGAVLWQPSLTNGIQGAEPDRLLGHPVWTDPNVASIASTNKVVAFGDWSAYYIRIAQGFTLERSDDFAFDKDLSTFRGLTRVDGDVIDGNAFNAIRVV